MTEVTQIHDPAMTGEEALTLVPQLVRQIRDLQEALQDQAEGAAHYMAAILWKTMGVNEPLVMTEEEMRYCFTLELERGIAPNNGFAARVVEPPPEIARAQTPVLAKVNHSIILPGEPTRQ